MKIHKRFQKGIDIGETTLCGLLVDHLPEESTTFIWKKVTCKSCLKHKTGAKQ